ncbi:non-ribosomal peptide synthetase [Microcoleus sp. ZQ-A2]|nr:amino acid adenylation domain-containing protein [Microcoleus sp. FACHB-1]
MHPTNSPNPTALSADELELLDFLLEDEDIEVSVTQTISRRENLEEAPLSFAQARLWFLDQLEPGSSAYNIPAAVRLVGVLNGAVLEQSLNAIIQRHEILRTRFVLVDEQPVQVITPTLTVTLPVVDLQQLTDPEAEIQRLAAQEAEQPFDLTKEPLLRVTLLKLGETEHILLFTIHHIIFDAWSREVLIRELATLYESFSRGQSALLPELPIQYADFAYWQRQWLQGEVLEQQLTYWKQHLGGNLPVLQLPSDRLRRCPLGNRARPPVQTFRGATQEFEVTAPLTEKLKQLGQSEGVTLFMTLLAAFETLLYRYTNQEDICVGAPISNRNRSEIEPLIGFFLNTLVLRTDLSGNPPFQELLARVRQVALDAYTHQDLPFEVLVEALQPERSLSHTPLFQVMFILQTAPLEPLELPGVTLTPLKMPGVTAKFDLTLYLRETEQGLTGAFEYSTDLFDEATIARMVEHFQSLLEGIVANPAQRLSELPLLTEAEQYQLLLEWNNTHSEYPQDQCIHQLFAAQVERTPDAVAVVFEDEHLTYRQLNERANQLAHYLQQLGVWPEVLVGICVERSLEMVVGLLGILKAGGAYVPLDPAYPPDRLAFMLEDAQVSVLLTQENLVAALPKHQAKVVCLDTCWEGISQASDDSCTNTATPENLAYIIYTSGSTGKPKGVQIPHSALVNFLTAMRQTTGLNERDILLSVTTLSFDIAALELYLPLIVGACTVIVSREVAADGTQLLKRLCSTKGTIMQATPATWRLLLAAGWQQNYPLKILCGGEALSRELANQLLEQGTEVWNLYGPTETTVWSAAYKVESQEGIVAIGRPIANTEFYVLDSHQQLVPVGVPGELYIGGAGLARGYLNRVELTAEKFITVEHLGGEDAHPTRLYKTGDLVRYRPDGTLEYLGRIDDQVKVRGFRIELGEVEAALSQHPAVRETAIALREHEPGNSSLVAYAVLHPEQTLTITELRQFLEAKLPKYMVPSVLVLLEALPLTPNGKVNRRALPAPDWSQRNSEQAYTAPHTPVEQVIADIWGEVLGVQQVGIDDNFFELGGHSLSATQLISRLRNVFQLELPLRHIFEYPTVASLGKAIAKLQQSKDDVQVSPLQPISRNGNLPLSFTQQRLWFLDQLEPNNTTYNMPAAVRLMGAIDIAALEQSFNEIVRRHEVLRTTFIVANGQPVQVITPTLTLTIPVVDLQALPETERDAEVLRLAKREAQLPFNLTKGSLLRVTLLKLSASEHILLFTIHHIICDGWSLGIFIREFTTLYDAFSQGKPSPLPELPIQYADFAHWQNQWLQGDVLENLLSYWQRQLAGAPSTLALPMQQQRPAVQSFRGETQSFQLSVATTEQLQILSRQAGVTLFMILLAAFQTLLHRYTHQDDIVVGTDVANRNRHETESLIGFFVNLLVMRTDLSGNPSFRELLERVREVALGAYAHQDLPFAKLVEALRPERNSSHTPLFQVLFVLQNAPLPALELSGLTVTPIEMNTGITRFDLALFMEETEQGIIGTWKYSTDLFEKSVIAHFSHHFETLLSSIVKDPDTRIDTLEMLSETEKQKQLAEQTQREKAKFNKFKAIKPKAVSLPQKQLIKTSFLQPEQSLPLVIEPDSDEIDLADWASSHREFIETNLLKHGAILFRGFNLNTAADFENVANAIHPNLFGEYGDLPREGVSGKVYGSTPYPPDKAILFHNESSHLHRWPLKIWFFCVQPAQQGGETPILDCRKIYQLLNPKLREKFEKKQLMYVRNYIDALDVSWQDFFHTTDKTEVENYCRQAGMEFEWLENNGLKTRKIRPAVAGHPKTGELVFFNQLQLHHVSCLDSAVRQSLLSLFGEDKLPRNVYYGDGTPIEDSVMEEIGAIYQENKISFYWQKGDILMLDNMLTSHSRNPYVGSRKIVVAMGELITNANV